MIKKYFKLAVRTNLVAIALWIFKIAFFLIKEGWHIKVVSKMELYSNNIINLLFIITFLFYLIAVFHTVELISEKEELLNNIHYESKPPKTDA